MHLRRLGLALAGLAVLVTTLILPWHCHEEAASAQKTHCNVCHFSKEVRSASPTDSLTVDEPTVGTLRIPEPVSPLFVTIEGSSSAPRAPPTV